MKIAIIGYIACGKSTLALKLSKIYGIPVFHTDKLTLNSQWYPLPRKTAKSNIAKVLEKNQDWIIDGTEETLLFDERLSRADKIIFLDLSLKDSIARSLKRYRELSGQERPSGPDGNKEVINWWTISCLLGQRNMVKRMMFKRVCRNYRDKITILKSQKEIDDFLQNLR